MTRQNPLDRQPRISADHVGVLLAGLAMMFGGWLGLAYLIINSKPNIGAELWLFFLLLHLATTGTVVPVVRYLNIRFTPITSDSPPGGIIVRQSVWIALMVVICTWLQILRSLSVTFAFLLTLVFVVLEIFLRSREANSAT